MTSTYSTISHPHKRQFARPRYELADVFNRYLGKYLRTHKLSTLQDKVVAAIQACRTSKLGVHLLKCDTCDYSRHEYDSCRNRHCPKCQGSNAAKWVGQRVAELLPIPYYHAVFTMPHSLNTLVFYNKELIYDMFFKAAALTLNAFAQDPRFLGAKIGFIGILHTWGQTLAYHVHLHFIVTGGGLAGERWLKLPYRKKFLFPAKAMSRRMRKNFAYLLDKAYHEGKLNFPDELSHLAASEHFERFLNKVAWQKSVTYVKKPFAGPKEVVKYIGRYTHRIAISNGRLISIDGGKVKFHYKRYHNNEVTPDTMTLDSDEFIRRFLLHVIPKGFKRIRYFGFLATACRTKALESARTLLAQLAEQAKQTKAALAEVFEGLGLRRCPACKSGILNVFQILAPSLLVPG